MATNPPPSASTGVRVRTCRSRPRHTRAVGIPFFAHSGAPRHGDRLRSAEDTQGRSIPPRSSKRKGVSMKRGLFILGAILALLVAGPALAQDYESVDPSGQTITFWHQHTRERETALQEIIDTFNTTNEYGITVVAEYQ